MSNIKIRLIGCNFRGSARGDIVSVSAKERNYLVTKCGLAELVPEQVKKPKKPASSKDEGKDKI